MPTLTLTHTLAEGTRLHGTEDGDGVDVALQAAGRILYGVRGRVAAAEWAEKLAAAKAAKDDASPTDSMLTSAAGAV